MSNADRDRAVWIAYEMRADGMLTDGRMLLDGTAWAKIKKGVPDGMKVDREGGLFASGPCGIHVFAVDGAHPGNIELDGLVSNVAWSGDGSTLYITAATAVYLISLATSGAGS